MDMLRGWNERSFLGWRSWWAFVSGVGCLAAVFQALGSTTPFSLYLVSVWILAVGALTLALARLVAWAGRLSPRAALAGLVRLTPIVWSIPLIDGAVSFIRPQIEGGVWWFAPSELWSQVLFAGCQAGRCDSLGLSIFSAGMLVALGWMGIRLGLRRGKAIGMALMGYVLFWLVLSIPSFTAWTRLSSYGTTLASPQQIVEQAFNRVWSGSVWSTNREAFWTLPVVGNQSGRILMGGVGLWLLCFGLLAPLLGRVESSRAAWERRLSQGMYLFPPVLLGMFLGFRSFTSMSWVAMLFGMGFFCAEMTVIWRAVVHLDDRESDPDQRWLAVAFSLMGAAFLGWPTLCALAIAFLIRWWGSDQTITRLARVTVLATSAWFLLLATWSLFARVDWSLIPRGLFVGMWVFLMGLVFWAEYTASRIKTGTDERLFGVWGPMMHRTALFGVFTGALVFLWATTGILSFAWVVGSFMAICAALLWLFPQIPRYIVLFSWFSMICMGLVLHSLR